MRCGDERRARRCRGLRRSHRGWRFYCNSILRRYNRGSNDGRRSHGTGMTSHQRRRGRHLRRCLDGSRVTCHERRRDGFNGGGRCWEWDGFVLHGLRDGRQRSVGDFSVDRSAVSAACKSEGGQNGECGVLAVSCHAPTVPFVKLASSGDGPHQLQRLPLRITRRLPRWRGGKPTSGLSHVS